MKNIKYLIVVIALLFGSCNEDQFSQIKVIELPEHSPLLAATAEFDKELSSRSVFVSHSKQLLDNTEYDIINDATVRMYKNGDLHTEFLWLENEEKYIASTPSSPFIDEGEYKMEISAPGYDPIEATQVLPKNCEILSAELKEDAFISEFGDKEDVLEIKIKDDGSERNFYGLRVMAEGTTPNGTPLIIETSGYSDDPIMEYGYIEEFLPDETFSGGTYIMRYVMNSYWEGNFQVNQGGEIEKLVIEVKSFSEDYFRYDVSRGIFDESQYVPFVEPILVTTNWDKGYGIFSLSNVEKFDLPY